MAVTSSKISKFPGGEPRPLAMPGEIAELLREGNDPTREIRRYIEQLQDIGRDAYNRQCIMEEENARLLEDISRGRKEMESLRDDCREARRERDSLSDRLSSMDSKMAELRGKLEGVERGRVEAVHQRDDTIKLYKDSQRQLEEASRIKEEAIKQRDAFSRQRDTAKKEREELSARVRQLEAMLLEARKVSADLTKDEFQKQLTAIRQARDASANLCADLKKRIAELEDEVAILKYDNEKEQEAAHRAHKDCAALREQLNQLNSDSSQRDESLRDELEETKKKTVALKERNAMLSATVDTLTTEVQQLRAAQEDAKNATEGQSAELRIAIEKMAQEREAEMEEYGTKLDELRAAHGNELQLARQQYEAAMKERDAARTRATEREAEVDALRSQLAEIMAVVDHLSAEALERGKELESLQAYAIRAETAEKALDELRGSLAAAQSQVGGVLGEREAMRAQLTAATAAMEEKLAAKEAEIDELRKIAETSEARLRNHEELVKEHEEHRLEMIEVSARLATAHGEIKQLSAQVAEARLKAKSAGRVHTGDLQDSGVEIDPALKNSLGALRRVFQEYLRQPSDFNLLNDLQNHAQHLADRARETDQMTVQRVSSVLSALTRELYETPEQATPPTMRSVGQGIEFIATLLKETNVDGRVELANVRAFAVDDDHSVLDAVCESLQAAGLNATTTDSAGAALAELATSAYDLIILDVNLPELDGLELCSHLREMPLHTTTPVIFITGHASLENRVQFSLRGGNELLIKPFNLLELALRSVSQIIKAKLKAKAA